MLPVFTYVAPLLRVALSRVCCYRADLSAYLAVSLIAWMRGGLTPPGAGQAVAVRLVVEV